jgi:hypothetical protein
MSVKYTDIDASGREILREGQSHQSSSFLDIVHDSLHRQFTVDPLWPYRHRSGIVDPLIVQRRLIYYPWHSSAACHGSLRPTVTTFGSP